MVQSSKFKVQSRWKVNSPLRGSGGKSRLSRVVNSNERKYEKTNSPYVGGGGSDGGMRS